MDPIQLFALIYNKKKQLINETAFIDYFAVRFGGFFKETCRNSFLELLTQCSGPEPKELSEEEVMKCELLMEFICAMAVMDKVNPHHILFTSFKRIMLKKLTITISGMFGVNLDEVSYPALAGLLDDALKSPKAQNLLPGQINWYLLRLGQGESCATELSTPPLAICNNTEERIQLQKKLLQIAPKKGFVFAIPDSAVRVQYSDLLADYRVNREKCQRQYYSPKYLFGGKPDKAYSRKIKLEAAKFLKLLMEELSENGAHISFSESHIKALQQGSLGRLVRDQMPEVYACLDALPREQAEMNLSDSPGAPPTGAAAAQYN